MLIYWDEAYVCKNCQEFSIEEVLKNARKCLKCGHIFATIGENLSYYKNDYIIIDNPKIEKFIKLIC